MSQDQKATIVKISFADFAFSTKGVEVGDFILPHDASGSIVFVIREINGKDVAVEVCLEQSDDKTPDDLEKSISAERIKRARFLDSGYLIKKPDPIDYYGGMLGIYLFHFFISDGSEHSEEKADFPAHIYSALREFPKKFGRSPSLGKKDSWESIKRHTIELIVWLTLGGFCYRHENGVDEKIVDARAKWRMINDEMIAWRKNIFDYAKSTNEIEAWSLLTGPSELEVFTSEARQREWNTIDPKLWHKHSARYISIQKESAQKKGNSFRKFLKEFDKIR